MVPPIKSTNRRSKIWFSAWLESMRKDEGCTFGILKGRWRILKTGIHLFGVKAADEILLTTCCALHNWLLETDGLDQQQWEHGVPSHWESCDGNEDNSTAISGTDGGCPDLHCCVFDRTQHSDSRCTSNGNLLANAMELRFENKNLPTGAPAST